MRRDSEGITLVEVLVAMVFTGLAFTALALSQVTGFRVTRSSQESAIARDLATRQLETFRAYGFDPYVMCPIPPESYKPDSYAGYPECQGSVSSTDHKGFTTDWDLSTRPVGTKLMSKPALIEARITVSWDDNEYHLTSYLSCGDPGEFATTDVPCPVESLL
jgi:type II secretory pathway pseudopilin PulG